MAGNKIGGQKAAATNKKRHGEDFYVRIGHKGGKNGHTGGFAANPELARIVGAKGGKKSRRGPAKRDADGNIIRKDGTRPNYRSTKKAKKAPEHGASQEKISMWQKLFRGGRTVIRESEDA